jgi:hypothetical protein
LKKRGWKNRLDIGPPTVGLVDHPRSGRAAEESLTGVASEQPPFSATRVSSRSPSNLTLLTAADASASFVLVSIVIESPALTPIFSGPRLRGMSKVPQACHVRRLLYELGARHM